MKGKNNILIACIASGIAVSPFVAYHFRPASLLFDGSMEEWFVSALRGGSGLYVFIWALIGCAILGTVVGALLKRVLKSMDDSNEFRLTLLRTPPAAAILVPFGTATILLVAYNHSSDVFNQVVWPDFYFQNWLVYSIVIAVLAAILAGLLNVLEHTFEQSGLLVRAGILCCSPLAICLGFVSMVGMIGCGLLTGAVVGRAYGSPITGAWTGACIAVVVLAVEGGIFWPAYFPITNAVKNRQTANSTA
jgi:hypothetical protein